MSISEKQLVANRANAQKSTGPKTEEGKNRVRINGRRHGLTGHASIMADEDREAYQEFCEPIVESLKPVNPIERSFAQLVAQAHYRLHRLHAIEENTFSNGHYTQAGDFEAIHAEVHNAITHVRVFAMKGDVFRNLGLYEQRISREMQKNLKILHELQDRRKAEEANQKPLKTNTANANGFAHSTDTQSGETRISCASSESPIPPLNHQNAA